MPLASGRLLLLVGGQQQTITVAPTTAILALLAADPAIQTGSMVSPGTAQLVLTAPSPGVGITAFAVTTAELALTAPDPSISVAFPTYVNGYGYRMRVAVPASSIQGGAAVADLPMLFYETLAPLKTVANGGRVNSASGFDIRVEDASGNKLSHEVATYDGATGEMLLWIRVPSLSVSATNILFVYYGKADLPATEANPSDCWKDYLAVWDARTGADRSGHGRDMLPTSVGAGTLIGDAGSYNGTSSLARRNDTTGIPWLIGQSAISVEAIVKSDVTGSKRGIVAVVPPSGTDADAAMFLAYVAPTSIQFQWRTSLGSNFVVSATGKQGTAAQHITATWASGSTPKLYVDGEVEAAPASGGFNQGSPLSALQTTLWLGVAPTTTALWDGLLDEVRIASAVLSAGRIATAYENTNDRHLFYGRGAEDVSTATTPSVVAVPMRVGTTKNAAVDIDVVAAAVVPAGAGSPTIGIVAQGSLGTATVVSNRIRYTPTTGADGTDAFTYSLTADGKTVSAKIQVLISNAVVTALPRTKSRLPYTFGAWNALGDWHTILTETTNPVGQQNRYLDLVTDFTGKYPLSSVGVWRNKHKLENLGNGNSAYENWIVTQGTPVLEVAWRMFPSHAAKFQNQPVTRPANSVPATWPVRRYDGNNPSAQYFGVADADWDIWIGPTVPPGTGINDGSLPEEDKRLRCVEVWRRASLGYFDYIWRAILEDFLDFIKTKGLHQAGKWIVFRPGWEWNTGADSGILWLYNVSLPIKADVGTMLGWNASMALAARRAEIKLYRDAHDRWASIARDVFKPANGFNGGIKFSHVGLKKGQAKIWAPEFFPSSYDYFGCDYYNIFPATPTQTWAAQSNEFYLTDPDNPSNLGPGGIVHWLACAKRLGKKLCIGEFGNWDTPAEGGGNAKAGTGDQPDWMENMLEFARDNAADIGYFSHFNGVETAMNMTTKDPLSGARARLIMMTQTGFS